MGDAGKTGEYVRCTEGTEREVAETENRTEEPAKTWTCSKVRKVNFGWLKDLEDCQLENIRSRDTPGYWKSSTNKQVWS